MCKIKYMLPIAGASPDHAVEAARDHTMATIIYEKSSNVVVVKHNTSAAAAADQEESNKVRSQVLRGQHLWPLLLLLESCAARA
jgi:hypothetical protein